MMPFLAGGPGLPIETMFECMDALDAFYSAEALEGTSSEELRMFVARTSAILARAEEALKARSSKTPYPSRLPPSLVLQFLPLPAVARALRVSTTWRDQAEPTFRAVAERLGAVRSDSAPWRDALRLHVETRWIGVLSSEFRHEDGLMQRALEHSKWPRTFVNRTCERDMIAIGRPTATEPMATLGFESSTEWDLVMTRLESETSDACGVVVFDGDDPAVLAHLDPTLPPCAMNLQLLHSSVLKLFLWNSDYNNFGLPSTLNVRGKLVEILPSDEFSREMNLDLEDYVFSSGDTLRMSATRNHSEMVFSLLREEAPNLWVSTVQSYRWPIPISSRRLIMAPVAFIFEGSSAEILRTSTHEWKFGSR